MNSPQTYAGQITVAIAEAIEAASTNERAKLITYHCEDVARACIASAVVFLNRPETGVRVLTQAQQEAWLLQVFREGLSRVTALHDNMLSADPQSGLAVRVLA